MIRIKAFLFGCCATETRAPEETIIQKNTPETDVVVGKNSANNYSVPNQTIKSTKISRITSEEVASAPLLVLRVIEGNILPLFSEYVINAAGITTGGRNKRNGIVYIGSQKYKISSKNSQQRLMNDILLNDPTVGTRHSIIKYNPSKKKYSLKDLGEGSGTFVKIEKELKLKSGFIVSFSDSHLLITISDGMLNDQAPLSEQQSLPKDALTLKFLEGPKINKTFTFAKEDKVVKIGRMNDCNIQFDGNNLSRYQCTFEYKEGGWYISDGFAGKTSTNGSWLFLEDFLEIESDVTIKIGQTLFATTIKPQK